MLSFFFMLFQAIIHPDTNEKILMPCRMSGKGCGFTVCIFWVYHITGFVPFGSITVIGLLLPNQTLVQMVFWQVCG